jgi:hypothetical protein
LCLRGADCQRHAQHEGQFRAMFVLNCTATKDAIVPRKGADAKQK